MAAPETVRETADRTASDNPAETPIPLQNELLKLLEFGRFYTRLRITKVKASLHKAMWSAVIGCTVAFAGAVMIVASVCMLLWSAATGLAEGAGLPLWVGRFVVAAGVLVAIGGSLAVIVLRSRARLLREALNEYEARKQTQQRMFGEDVEHAARKPA